MFPIPWIAILIATVAAFFFGAFWYSKIAFGRTWMKEAGLSEAACKGKNPVVLLGTTFVLTLISVGVFSFCLGQPGPGIKYGAIAGLVIGIGWVATSIGSNYLFEGKSLKFFAINAGFHIVRFMIIGIILGLFQ